MLQTRGITSKQEGGCSCQKGVSCRVVWMWLLLVCMCVPSVAQRVTRVNLPSDVCNVAPTTVTIGYRDISTIKIENPQASLGHSERIFLPDGVSCSPYGCSYISPVTFTSFYSDSRVTSVEDINFIRLNIEHSFIGDLYMNITCPNGQKADLLKWSGSGSSPCNARIGNASRSWKTGSNMSLGTYLGEAYDMEDNNTCDSTKYGNGPGVGWNYCWSNRRNAGYVYADDDGIIYRSSHEHNGRVDSSDVAARRNFYRPDDSLSALIGCPLNGTWQIEVIDGWSGDNGYIFNWEIAMNENLLPPPCQVSRRQMIGSYTRQVNDSTFVIDWPQNILHDTTLSFTFSITSNCGTRHDTTVYVRVHPPSNTTQNIYGCDQVVWNGRTFTQSTTVNQHLLSRYGCDSMARVNLVVQRSLRTDLYDTIVQNQLPYRWNNELFTQQGTKYLPLRSHVGCDSAVYLHLHVWTNRQMSVDSTICESQLPFTWNGLTFTSAAVRSVVLRTTHGADSTVSMTVRVLPTKRTTIRQQIVENQLPWTYGGITFRTNVEDTLLLYTSQTGCDSIVTYSLTVWRNAIVNYDTAVCSQSLPITWRGRTFTQATTYTQRLQTVHGADSTVSITLRVNPSYNISQSASICDNESYTFEGQRYSTAGSYSRSFRSVHGCDSIRHLTLTVRATSTGDTTADVCDQFSWYGHTYSQPGNVASHLSTNAAGCDSTTTLHLAIRHSSSSVVFDTVVENSLPRSFNGHTFRSDVQHTPITITNTAGCDSVIDYSLHVHRNVRSILDSSVCFDRLPLAWNSLSFSTNVNATAILQQLTTIPSHTGSDSIILMRLHVNPTYAPVTNASICDNESYTFEGQRYSTAGSYSRSFRSVHGCDSIRHLVLTVRATSTGDTTADVCDQFSWYGHTYSQPGNVAAHLSTNAAGCDSTTTLHLAIRHSSSSVVFDTVVENSLPRSFNGHTFRSDVQHTPITITNTAGCDSVIDYSLHVHRNVRSILDSNVCFDRLPLVWNSLSFSTNVNATAILQQLTTIPSHTGSDSIILMRLHVNPTYAPVTNASICDNESYTFEGQRYSTAGSYSRSFRSVHGCDSIRHLTLTVRATSTGDTTADVCDQFSWYGHTYSQPGNVASHLSTNAVGCDSTTTLHLAIRHSSSSVVFDTVVENSLPRSFNGHTFRSDVQHTPVTITNTAGCDSVIDYSLHVHRNVRSILDSSVCFDRLPLVWNSLSFSTNVNATAILQQLTTIPSHTGSDSIILMRLHVNPTYAPVTNASICDNESYRFGVRTLTAANTYIDSLRSIMGCDSVSTLHLRVNPTYDHTNRSVVCQNHNFTWGTPQRLIWRAGNEHEHGVRPSRDTVVTDHLQSVYGCDSLSTLRLTIHPAYDIHHYDTICDDTASSFCGTRYRNAGSYVHEYDNMLGCDSVMTLHLHVNPTWDIHVYDTIYDGDRMAFEGRWYDTTGVYPVHIDSRWGCDSLRTLHLQRNRRTYVDSTLCVNMLPITWNGVRFAAANGQRDNYYTVIKDSVHLRGREGIDSLVVMTVRAKDTSASNDVQHGCDSLTWRNGINYTQSTTRPYLTYENQYGCDSVEHLLLTIDYTHPYLHHINACDSTRWIDDNWYYSDTLGPQHTLPTVAGCDSIVTLELKMHYATYRDTVDTICYNQHYSWRNQQVSLINQDNNITTTGTLLDTLRTQYQCDSVIAMHLTQMAEPNISFDVSTDCELLTYTVDITCDVPYTYITSYPNDNTLIGREQQRRLTLDPPETTDYMVYADYREEPFCPTTRTLRLRPVNIPLANLKVVPEVITYNEIEYDLYDNGHDVMQRWWYINGVLQTDTSSHLHRTADINADTIEIMLKIFNGRCINISTYKLPVLRIAIFAPNAFTPDLETNSKFVIKGHGVIDGELYIFNRDGLLVYHTDDYTQGWTGYGCPQANYVWKLNYRAIDYPTTTRTMVGSVLLIR